VFGQVKRNGREAGTQGQAPDMKRTKRELAIFLAILAAPCLVWAGVNVLHHSRPSECDRVTAQFRQAQHDGTDATPYAWRILDLGCK